MKKQVLIRAVNTPNEVGIGLLIVGSNTWLMPHSGCCKVSLRPTEDHSGGECGKCKNPYVDVAPDIGTKLKVVQDPGMKDLFYYNRWVEEWTGLENITVNIEWSEG